MAEGIASIVSADHLELADILYPLSGDVAVSGLGAFPPKVTIGDNTRDTAQLVSSINLGNWQGGWLHRILDAGQQPEWVWQSTADTRFRRQALLPPQAQSGNAGLPTAAPATWTKVYFAYLDRTFALTSDGTTSPESIVYWDPALATWVTSHTAGTAGWDYTCAATLFKQHTPTAVVGSTGGYTKGQGTSWTDVPAAAPGGGGAGGSPALYNVVAFGDTYYGSDSDGYMWVCTGILPAGDTWTRSAESVPVMDVTNPGGPIRALIVFRDKDGDPAIHVLTRTGVYIYDITATFFRPTDLQFPYQRSTIYQRAVCLWRGDLYIGAGQSLFRYNGSTIESVGLDRVDGLPVSFAQPIHFLADAYNWLIIGTDFHLFAWDGTGVHLLFTTTGAAPPPPAATQYIQDVNYLVSHAGGQTRLWWSTTNQAVPFGNPPDTITRYLDLDRELFNPRTSSSSAYEQTAYLVTPYFTAGWDELDKLWIEAQVAGQQILPGLETLDIQYQTNDTMDMDPVWGTLGTLSENGPVVMPFGPDGAGLVSKAIRMRVNFARRLGASAPENSHTPILLYISLKFQRLLDRLYGYSFVIDVPRQADLAGYRTPEALCNALQTAYETKPLLHARFRRDGQEVGNLPTRPVQVSQFNIQTRPSAETGFKATVSLVEVG